jgi:hypothetical protein
MSNKGKLPIPSRIAVLRGTRAETDEAGIAEDVSPHWLQHAHGSHAIERGASLSSCCSPGSTRSTRRTRDATSKRLRGVSSRSCPWGCARPQSKTSTA